MTNSVKLQVELVDDKVAKIVASKGDITLVTNLNDYRGTKAQAMYKMESINNVDMSWNYSNLRQNYSVRTTCMGAWDTTELVDFTATIELAQLTVDFLYYHVSYHGELFSEESLELEFKSAFGSNVEVEIKGEPVNHDQVAGVVIANLHAGLTLMLDSGDSYKMQGKTIIRSDDKYYSILDFTQTLVTYLKEGREFSIQSKLG